MSATVDTRVVQIQFDNKQFEQNVQQTIDSLERLNNALSGTDSAKNGLNELTKGTSSELSNISAGVDNISGRFSVMGVVGATVINRLTNAGIDMAMKIGNGMKAVTTQIKQGGKSRAANLEQAKFLLEGLAKDNKEVDLIMKNVNAAVDGTAYGLDEAAKASASFYASGIKGGPQMESALSAVSGVAAMVGSDYSSIAEIFTTVAGQGKVMTMQLRQLEARGLNAAAILAESMGKSEEEIRDMVTKGEISFEDFTKAMGKFAEHAKDANKTFSGSLANMKTSLSRLGEAFITPAMQAAVPLFNSIRRGISAFTTSLKEDGGAVDKFSKKAESLGKTLANTIDSFNGKGSNMNAFRDFGKSAEKILDYLYKAAGKVGEAFKEVFPEASIQNIKGFIIHLNSMISAFTKSEKGLNTFKNIMVVLFSAIKIGVNVLSVAFKIIKTGVSLISSPLATITKGFANFSNALANIGSGKELTIFSKVASTTANIVKSAFKAILDVFDGLKNGIKGGIDEIHSFQDALAIVGAMFASGWFVNTFMVKAKDFKKGLDLIFKPLYRFLNPDNGTLAELMLMPEKVNTVLGTLTGNMGALTRNVKADSLQKIAVGVLALAVALKILSTIDAPGLAKSLSAVSVMLFEMTVVLQILMKSMADSDFTKSLKNIYALGSVTNALIKIGVAMILMAAALKIISSLDPKELARGLIGLTVMLGAVLGFVIVIEKYGSSDKKLAGVAITLIGISTAMLILSQSVKQLSELNIGELAKGLGSVAILLGAVMGFIIGVSKLSSGGSAGMIAAGVGMIAIAAALNILVPVLQKLGSMNLIQLAQGMAAIVVAMGAMAGVSQFMSAGGAAGMLIMAISLSVLAGAIERLGNMDIKSLAIGLGTLVVAIAAFAGLSILLSAAIAPMLGIAAAMLVLSTAIAVLGAGLVMIGAGLAGIAAGIMSFASVSQTAVLMFANTIQTLIAAIIQMFPQIAASLAESFVVFLEQIAELAPRFRDAMTTIITELLGAVNDNIPNIINTGLNLILSFLSGLEEAMPQIAEKGVNIISGFISGVAQGIPQIVQAGFDLMLNFINGLADGIRNNQDAVNKAIWNLCTAILESFKSFFGISSPSTVMAEMGGYLMEGLLNGINAFSGIGSAIAGAVKKGVNSVGKFTGNFKTKGGELIKGVAQGIKTKGGDVKTRAGDAVKKAKDKVDEYKEKFKTAGKSLAEGIGNGINAKVDWVKTQVGNLADALKRKVKEKLHINSPSKVFAKIAEGIPEGMALGIKKAGRYAIKAVSNLADSTIEPVSKALSNFESYMDLDSDFNPTITPILDLSEVEKSARGIDSIFGNNTISLAASAGQNAQFQNNNLLMSQLIDKLNRTISGDNKPTTINNTFNIDGAESPESFVNDFIRALDREMKMRAV